MRSMLGLALVALSCAPEPPVPYQAPGTKRMAARLAEIAQNLNPAINTYINAARVEYLKTLPQPPDTASRLRASAYLARELLRAGQSQAAIDEFEKLQPQLQQVDLRLTPDVRVLLGLSYMRLGEQENCLARHATASCLLPIGSDGIHSIERGSRAALAEFAAYLADHPDDLTVRWLLNIAYMTLGMYPEQVPAQWLVPPEVFVSDYDIKRFADVAPALGLDLVSMAGGGIMDDFDGDGHLDIMASSWGSATNPLFCQPRRWSLCRTDHRAGLTGSLAACRLHTPTTTTTAMRTYWFCGGWWKTTAHPNSLLHNNGKGPLYHRQVGLLTFHPTQTAAWGDYETMAGWTLPLATMS